MSASALHLSPRLVLADVHADVWHAHALATPGAQVVATGDALLDAQLPGGGWPVGALTELLQAPGVHGEWRLLTPALARSGTAAVVLVGAPHVPFGPALAAQGLATRRLLWVQSDVPAQRLWAAEQALRCAGVDAVLAWLPQARADQLRRLQMAAAEYARLLFVVRASTAQNESSPAVLRMLLEPAPDAHAHGPAHRGSETLQVRLLKRRGPPLERPLCLPARVPALARLLAVAQEVPDALDRTAARA